MEWGLLTNLILLSCASCSFIIGWIYFGTDATKNHGRYILLFMGIGASLWALGDVGYGFCRNAFAAHVWYCINMLGYEIYEALFAVYVYIISHMYSIGENTSISLPNPGLLCKSLGISVSTYDKAVNDLLNIGMIYKSPHTTIFVNGDFVNAKPMYTKTPGLLTKNFIINYWKKQTGNDYVKV